MKRVPTIAFVSLSFASAISAAFAIHLGRYGAALMFFVAFVAWEVVIETRKPGGG